MQLLLFWVAILSATDEVTISVDATARGSALRQVWPYFGYDECNYTTAPAARDLMRTLARTQPEPVYLRQHFLLASGDGKPSLKWGSTNVYAEDASGKPIYDWRILDGIFDAVIEAGCRPLVEIGFMPKDLSAKPEPYQLPTFGKIGSGVSQPPKDYAKWEDLIRAWARHSAERYPGCESTWWWELWNEPNIGYWQGTFEEYCKLYDHTERALHEVLPKAILGGPHTVGGRLDFLRRFLEHCARGTRLDYVGFHSKGSTRIVDGHVRMELRGNLAMNREAFATIASFPEFRDKPIIIGECDPEGAAALSSSRAAPSAPARSSSEASARPPTSMGSRRRRTMAHRSSSGTTTTISRPRLRYRCEFGSAPRRARPGPASRTFASTRPTRTRTRRGSPWGVRPRHRPPSSQSFGPRRNSRSSIRFTSSTCETGRSRSHSISRASPSRSSKSAGGGDGHLPQGGKLAQGAPGTAPQAAGGGIGGPPANW